MAKNRKGGVHAANQSKAKARWKQVTKDLSSQGSIPAGDLAKHLAKDTAALFSEMTGGKPSAITKSIENMRKSVESRSDKVNAMQRKANAELVKALKAVGDDDVKRRAVEDEFQAKVFDRIDALQEKLGDKKESLDEKLKDLKEEFVDGLKAQAKALSKSYEDHFQRTRKLRSKEYRDEQAKLIKSHREDNDPEFRLQNELNDLRKQQQMLSRGLLRRYAVDPLIGNIKDRAREKWSNIKRKTGITAVSNFVDKERKRRDDLDELKFKIAQSEAEKLTLNPTAKAASGTLEDQAQGQLANREVSALEKIAQSIGRGRKDKKEEETSGLLEKLGLGLPLLAAAIPAAISGLGNVIGRLLGKVAPGVKNAVASAAEAASNGASSLYRGAKNLITNPVGTFKSWVTSAKNAAEDLIESALSKSSKAWGSVLSTIRSAPGEAMELMQKAGRSVFQFLTAAPSKSGFLNLVKGLFAKVNPATALTGLRKLISAGVTGVVFGVLVDMLVDTVASSLGLSPSTASLVKMILNAGIAIAVGGAGGLAIYVLIEASIFAYEQFQKFPDKEALLAKLKGTAVKAEKAIASGAKAAVNYAEDVTTTATGAASHAISSAVAAANGDYPAIAANVSSLSSGIGSAVSSATDYVLEGAGSAYKTVKSALGKLFRPTSPDINVDKLHPAMQHRLLAMAQEYEAMYGEPLDLNSAFRSYSKQAELYRKDPKRAARPGTSLHEVGLAADFKPSQVDKLKSAGLLEKYGLEGIRGSNERQHVQMKGGSALAKANRLTAGDNVSERASIGKDAMETGSSDNASNIKASLSATGSPSASGNQSTSAAPSSIFTSNSGGSGLGGISIDSVPTFSYQDHSFFALNLGAIGG